MCLCVGLCVYPSNPFHVCWLLLKYFVSSLVWFFLSHWKTSLICQTNAFTQWNDFSHDPPGFAWLEMRLWGSLSWFLGAMGANTSQVSDLSESQSIRTLIGPDAISENEPFWNQLISFTFTSPTSRWDAPLTPSLMSRTLTLIQIIRDAILLSLSEYHLFESKIGCLCDSCRSDPTRLHKLCLEHL